MINAQRGIPEGMAGEYLAVAGKATPSTAVSGLILAGVPLESWVVILTLVFLLLQIGHAVYKIARDLRRGRGDADG